MAIAHLRMQCQRELAVHQYCAYAALLGRAALAQFFQQLQSQLDAGACLPADYYPCCSWLQTNWTAADLCSAPSLAMLCKGYGTVRDVKDTEKVGEKPVQDCVIAHCGELPADADLAAIPTFTAQVRACSRELAVSRCLVAVCSEICVKADEEFLPPLQHW